jgi:hypothetical protein
MFAIHYTVPTINTHFEKATRVYRDIKGTCRIVQYLQNKFYLLYQKKEIFCTEADPRPEDIIEKKEEKEESLTESKQVNRNSSHIFKGTVQRDGFGRK